MIEKLIRSQKYKDFKIEFFGEWVGNNDSVFVYPKENKPTYKEPMKFDNYDKAKEHIDLITDDRARERAISGYQAKYGDHKTYTIVLSKMNGGRHAVCDIENKNLEYGENTTGSGQLYQGLQCNHIGGTKNHEEIGKLCSQVSDLMIKIHNLNNE